MKRKSLSLLVLLLLVTLSAAIYANTEVRVTGYGGTDQQIVEELLAKFVTPVASKEGIDVVYEPISSDYQRVLLNSLSAGTGADLFYMDVAWAQNIIKQGLVAPLDTYISKSDVIKKDDIISSLVNAYTYNGKLYGIAKDFNSLALFYNKTLFDVAGVDYPNADDTWQTLEDKLSKVVQIDDNFKGLALQPEFARMGALALANGWQMFNEDGSTNLLDPAFKEAFSWYTGLKKKGLGVVPADLGQGWGGGAFLTGNVAACIEGAWMLGSLRDQAPNLDYGVTLLPKSPNTGKRGNLLFTVAWGMNSASEHKDAAFRVMELLTSPEAQQWVLERGLAIPSRKSLADNPYFDKDTPEAQANKIVFKGASDGLVKSYYFRDYGGNWMDPINTALNEVLTGQSSVDDALNAAEDQLNDLMSDK